MVADWLIEDPQQAIAASGSKGLAAPSAALALRMHAPAFLTVIHAAPGMGKTQALLVEHARLRMAGIRPIWIDGAALAAATGRAGTASHFRKLPTDAEAFFVDDAHRLPRAALDAIIAATAGRSSRTRVLLAVRRLDGLGLARRAAQAQVNLIDGSLLAWSRRQLTASWTPELSAMQIASIDALAEGWAAPLQLLARWMANGESIDPRRSYLRASLVSTYIDDELLSAIPQWALRPLMTAALPVGFDQDLLDSLAEARSLQVGMLQDHLGTLLVQQEDDWRLNRLLREHLLASFGRLPPEQRRMLTRMVADWSSQRGDVVGAARLVSQSGGGRQIVHFTVKAGGLTLWLVKGYDYVRNLVQVAGDALVASEPRLQLLRCVVLLKEGRIGEAERLYRDAVVRLPADPEARRDAALVQATLTVYGCRIASTRDDSAFQLLDRAGADPGWRTMLPTIRAIRHSQQANFGAATAALVEATAHSVAAGITYNLLFLDFHKAGVSLAQGALEPARKILAGATRRWRTTYREDRGAETVLNALMAQLDFESGRRRQAIGHLRKSAHRLPHSEAWLDIYVAAYEPMMRLLAEEHGVAAASAAIARANGQLHEQSLSRIADLLLALCACLEGEARLRGENIGSPAQNGDIFPTGEDGDQTWHEMEFFGLARAYGALGAGDLERSRGELGSLLEFSRARGLLRTELRALLLRCATYDRLGLLDLADADFEVALTLAAQSGMRRAFWDFGADSVQRRLDPKQRRAFPRPLRSIVNEIQRTRWLVSEPADRPLSTREKDVLGELRAGGSDKTIGRRLGITEHAVRFHLKNIYKKLAVHNRHDAIKVSLEQAFASRSRDAGISGSP